MEMARGLFLGLARIALNNLNQVKGIYMYIYLTIIPQGRMGYDSIAHEDKRDNFFNRLVGQ